MHDPDMMSLISSAVTDDRDNISLTLIVLSIPHDLHRVHHKGCHGLGATHSHEYSAWSRPVPTTAVGGIRVLFDGEKWQILMQDSSEGIQSMSASAAL